MINLILALHNHQPVGNFGHVFEKAFKECYWPVLDTFAEFPDIKVVFHHSGPLLDWAKQHEPEYLKKLVGMVNSGQVEILGGGYYEPILAVIPPQDAAGQLKMMSDFWDKEAGIRPKGIWTTERIWEPSLTTLLADNGVKYTILDDEHFRAAGIIDEFVLNYYLTERHGKTTSVFASDKTLRYYLPFKLPEDVIAHLLYVESKYPGSAVTYGDDGEKFGMWPGTYEWVIQKGWLRKFLTLLTQNRERIRTCSMSEFHEKGHANGTAYLPTCSYPEMGEWAMPAHSIHRLESVKEFLAKNGRWEDAKPFVRGSYWDNFLSKYPESNYMHKKMLYVSDKLEKQIRNGQPGIGDHMIEEARRHLYKAQCNCAYWHGLFGGLYLNYLRHAIFENLIRAENILDDIQAAHNGSRVTRLDIDCDHDDEVMLANRHLIAVVKPSQGAGIVELSHRRSALNLRNVLARREEGYHKRPNAAVKVEEHKSEIASIHDINKDPAKAGPIVYDSCNRFSFCDNIWKADSNPVDCRNFGVEHAICGERFHISSIDREYAVTALRKNGFYIEKIYHMGNDAKMTVEYLLRWDAPLKEPLRFGTSLNLTLLAGHDPGRYYLLQDGKRQMMDITSGPEQMDKLSLVDEHFKLRLDISADKKMDIWRYPVNTVSQSESGFDLLYQGSCMIWSILIPAGTSEFDLGMTLEFV